MFDAEFSLAASASSIAGGNSTLSCLALLMSYAARLPRPPVFWVSSPMREDVNELRRNRDLSRTDRPSAIDRELGGLNLAHNSHTGREAT